MICCPALPRAVHGAFRRAGLRHRHDRPAIGMTLAPARCPCRHRPVVPCGRCRGRWSAAWVAGARPGAITNVLAQHEAKDLAALRCASPRHWALCWRCKWPSNRCPSNCCSPVGPGRGVRPAGATALHPACRRCSGPNRRWCTAGTRSSRCCTGCAATGCRSRPIPVDDCRRLLRHAGRQLPIRPRVRPGVWVPDPRVAVTGLEPNRAGTVLS